MKGPNLQEGFYFFFKSTIFIYILSEVESFIKMAELPDYILVEQAQHGDSDAVALLYRRYVPAITRYIAYRVATNDAVEDLTAEVFLRMIEGLGHFQITGAPLRRGSTGLPPHVLRTITASASSSRRE
jgi:hypothetical protein